MAITIRPLDPAQTDAAFTLATQVFVEGSTLHRALGIALPDYRAYLRPSFEAMVRESLSMMAIDEDRLVGCLICTDFHAPSLPAPKTPIAETFAPLTALTQALGALYTAQRPLKPGEALLVDMAAVSPLANGRGLYRRMREAAQAHAATRGYRVAIGELSSAATQHVILTTMDHRKRAELFFNDFAHEGRYPFASITTPPSIILAEGDIRRRE